MKARVMMFCMVFFAGVLAAGAQTATKQSYKCTTTNGLAETEIADLIGAHNLVRLSLKLAPLVWDCRLAGLAQDWAKRGMTQHREGNEFGESIFVAGARDVAAFSAVNKWVLEQQYWDNKTGACRPGKVCTHYTQVVWKKTRKIGCGINRNLSGKWKAMLVCNYDPAGNNPGPAY